MRRLRYAKQWLLALTVASIAASSSLYAQATGTVSGTITGAGGRALAGASVTVAGTGRGATTNAQGAYSITAVPAGSRTVRATFAGHAEGTRTVTVAAGQTATVNLTLTAQVVQLDAVVAIGYGTARRRDVAGSVASVSAEDAITKAAPTSQVASALQGKAPGVQVTSNSGAPGGAVSVRVRGSNSITANSEPLYVVDGLPVAQGSAGTGNPLQAIDPSDIESMEILKDASQTAIYGARGANGVILITTKRGTRGQNRIEIESSYGIQQSTADIPMLNGPQFMAYVNEANANANRARVYSDAQIAAAGTTDYVGLITRDAPQMNHAITASGGDETTRFLVGANYSQQQGIIERTEFNRYGLRLNLDREMNTKFRIGNSLSLTYVNRNDPSSSAAYHAAVLYFPWVPVRNDAGDYNRDLGQFGVQGVPPNPVATVMEQVNDQAEWRGIGNVFAEYDLTDALRLRSSFGGNFGFDRRATYNPRTISQGFANNGTATVNTSQSRDLTQENLLTYRAEVGPGNLDLLIGNTYQTADDQNQELTGQNTPADVLTYHDLAVTTTSRNVDTGESAWTLLSFLGRANYNLLDRYIFTATARRDGSSRFGADNKWAFFPSAAFAWRVIDEGFMQNQTLLSDLKLRVSYGRTGNQAINEYQSLPRLETQFYAFGRAPVENAGISPSQALGNSALKWETQEQINTGFDLGFLDNRVSMTFDAYQSTTRDLLLTVDLPWTTGGSTQLQNVGSIRNRGLEFGLNTLNFDGDFFTWRTGLNVSRNKNEVLSLSGDLQQILPSGSTAQGLSGGTNVIRVGEPLGSIFGIKTYGLFQAGDACPFTATPAKCAPGEIKAADLNGDGQFTIADREIIGNGDPDFYGGLNSNMTFGPVSLDAFFNFSRGNELANLPGVYSMLGRGIVNERLSRYENRWTPTNTNTDVPRLNNARDGFLYDILVEDASFIRLQTLTLGYRLPDNLIPSVSSARLFLTGQNVWLHTNYSGYDPEANARGGSSVNRGIDFETFPRARAWNIGAALQF